MGPTEDELREMYWGHRMTLREMADELDRGKDWVAMRMKKHGVERRGTGMTEEQYFEDVVRVASELGRPPTIAEYEELGEYSTQYARHHFEGGWAGVKERAAEEAAGVARGD